MLNGNSIDHVSQGIGCYFSKEELKGYFNDLTGKVLLQEELLGNDRLPLVSDDNDKEVIFPVAIIQYGLGCYDLFLKTSDKLYYKKFLQCVVWAAKNQLENGAWDNFSVFFADHPYGAMCQGEAASLLLRAYKETNNEEYLFRAKHAIDFMLLPVEKGGVTKNTEYGPCFLECTNCSPILNGWIFALFGLYDFCFVDPSYSSIFEEAINCLTKTIGKYDSNYWSFYDMDNHIASPFYHDLHIAQLVALETVTNNEEYTRLRMRFENYKRSKYKSTKAFIIKAVQKVLER